MLVLYTVKHETINAVFIL